jgi:hypothetical protein
LGLSSSGRPASGNAASAPFHRAAEHPRRKSPRAANRRFSIRFSAAIATREEVFNPNWQPPADRVALAEKLMTEYNVRSALDCSTCHR